MISPLPRSSHQPLPQTIANLIEDEIRNGGLAVGTKLPTQRDLAYKLGIAVATVGRAYRICIERGLVTAEVGRGTYVLSRDEQQDVTKNRLQWALKTQTNPRALVQHAARMHSTSPVGNLSIDILDHHISDIMKSDPAIILDHVRVIPQNWLEAGRNWLSTAGWKPQIDSIVPTNGAYVGLLAAAMARTKLGDRVAVEEPGYVAVTRTLKAMGRRVVTVAVGEEGMQPEAFQRVCAQYPPKILFVTPTIHNPTGRIMPLKNRQKIVEIARRHDVFLIEDNVYGGQVENPLPPIAQLAPERSFHVNSLSKTVCAGLRTGWISCPAGEKDKVVANHGALCGHWAFLAHEIAARMVLTGSAVEAASRLLDEVKSRHEIFAGIFRHGHFKISTNISAPFAWIEIPELTSGQMMKFTSSSTGVTINQQHEFFVESEDAVGQALRLAFVGVPDQNKFREHIQRFHDLLAAKLC